MKSDDQISSSGEQAQVRFCPDGVAECVHCRNGGDLLVGEMCDDCGRSAPDADLSDCPYFRHYLGGEPGVCSYGCRDEPSCITDRPLHGWPSEQRAKAQHSGSSEAP